MPPTRGNGKICYLQIPTTDVARSADFYRRVFGWNIRQRGEEALPLMMAWAKSVVNGCSIGRLPRNLDS